MTKEDIKTIIDIVHKTIYGFFDVCDEEETPMTDKDKLLLKINKAICTNIKALEQEPCEDAISRQAVIKHLHNEYHGMISDESMKIYEIINMLKEQPSVTPQPKTGHWIYDRTRDWDGECKYECSECGMGSDVDYAYCMRCGAKMIEPQESEDKYEQN